MLSGIESFLVLSHPLISLEKTFPKLINSKKMDGHHLFKFAGTIPTRTRHEEPTYLLASSVEQWSSFTKMLNLCGAVCFIKAF